MKRVARSKCIERRLLQAERFSFSFSEASELPTACRRIPAHRTRERDRTSGGGLAGLDASGWPLLAIKHETRWRGVEGRETWRTELRRTQHERGADEARNRAKRRAKVARFARVRVCRVMICRSPTLPVYRFHGLAIAAMVGVRDHLELHLNAVLRDWTKHGGSKCASQREQHSQKHQKPDANCFHTSEVITRGEVQSEAQFQACPHGNQPPAA
jgi:hypothetical protein